jgi:hypothetical protein
LPYILAQQRSVALQQFLKCRLIALLGTREQSFERSILDAIHRYPPPRLFDLARQLFD